MPLLINFAIWAHLVWVLQESRSEYCEVRALCRAGNAKLEGSYG